MLFLIIKNRLVRFKIICVLFLFFRYLVCLRSQIDLSNDKVKTTFLDSVFSNESTILLSADF